MSKKGFIYRYFFFFQSSQLFEHANKFRMRQPGIPEGPREPHRQGTVCRTVSVSVSDKIAAFVTDITFFQQKVPSGTDKVLAPVSEHLRVVLQQRMRPDKKPDDGAPVFPTELRSLVSSDDGKEFHEKSASDSDAIRLSPKPRGLCPFRHG